MNEAKIDRYSVRMYLSSPKRNYHWQRVHHFDTQDALNAALSGLLKDERCYKYRFEAMVTGGPTTITAKGLAYAD